MAPPPTTPPPPTSTTPPPPTGEPITDYGTLRTPPRHDSTTPTSNHRRNRHTTVLPLATGPMISTARGLMPLSPLRPQAPSPSPRLVPRFGRMSLGTIGETSEDREDLEGDQKGTAGGDASVAGKGKANEGSG